MHEVGVKCRNHAPRHKPYTFVYDERAGVYLFGAHRKHVLRLSLFFYLASHLLTFYCVFLDLSTATLVWLLLDRQSLARGLSLVIKETKEISEAIDLIWITGGRTSPSCIWQIIILGA